MKGVGGACKRSVGREARRGSAKYVGGAREGPVILRFGPFGRWGGVRMRGEKTLGVSEPRKGTRPGTGVSHEGN